MEGLSLEDLELFSKLFISESNEAGALIGEMVKNNKFPSSYEEMLKKAPENQRQHIRWNMRAETEGAKTIEKELRLLEQGKKKPLISFEEPDQSPLHGYESYLMRHKWANGMDIPGGMGRPMGMPYFSDWYMAIYLGNYTDFMKMVDALDKDELKKQLNKRESLIQLCAIFLPIVGARVFRKDEKNGVSIDRVRRRYGYKKHECRHMDILKKLIDLGADLDTHDVAGFTPLHHCLSASSNDYTFAMAVKLLEAGANPNGVNRFGAPPLQSCVMENDLRSIELLIKFKANPYIKDYDGLTAAQIGGRFPNVMKLLKAADKHLVKKERDEAKTKFEFKKCGKCKGKADKRCTGCFLTWYCSADCQKTHWSQHRDTCKKTMQEFEEVEMVSDVSSHTHSFKNGASYWNFGVTDKPKTTSFIVKVQVCLTKMDSPMLVYNKERNVFYYISTESKFGKVLKKVIVDADTCNLYKGYFYSITKNGKHYINPTILPYEQW